MTIKTLTLLLLSIFLSSCGQNPEKKDCYEIKYLDFFGYDKLEYKKWPESELKKFLKIDFREERIDTLIKTNFIIPMIIQQLAEYHSNCTLKIDTLHFNQLSKIYLKIREIDTMGFANKSILEKFEFMCTDFYKQVEDENYLPEMIMTFDDGPMYGINFDQETELEPVEIKETNFGFLIVSSVNNKIILTCKDRNEKIIWQKSITGMYDRNLTKLCFTENAIDYNSVATVVPMYSEGERFTLFLKEDGEFMFYFHSW